jgi:hypothetical protein
LDIEPEIITKLDALGFRYPRPTDDITLSTHNPRKVEGLGEAIQLIHRMLRSHGFRRKGKKERISTQAGQMIVNNLLTVDGGANPRKYGGENSASPWLS